jgi:hypothetical protein
MIEHQAPGIVKTQPNPSDREVLAGLVERVTYHNVENGFCVLRATLWQFRMQGVGDYGQRSRTADHPQDGPAHTPS